MTDSTIAQPVFSATVHVKFIGGPRAGQIRRYRKTPRYICCATEAIAVGMWGLYQVPVEVWKNPHLHEAGAVWQDKPKRNNQLTGQLNT